MNKVLYALVTTALWCSTVAFSQEPEPEKQPLEATREVKGQEPSVSVSVTPAKQADTLKWVYSFKFTGFEKPGDVRIRLPLPRTAVSIPRAKGAIGAPERQGTDYVWKYEPTSEQKQAGSFDVSLDVFAPVQEVKGDVVRWRAEVGAEDFRGDVQGPVRQYDPSFVRPVFGGGGSLRFDDYVDFKVEDGYLLTTVDSRTRAAALVGVLFKLSEVGSFCRVVRFQEKKPLDLLVSLEFAEDTRRTLDGFVFGLGFGISRYAEIIVGYQMRKGTELSHGFRREAARIAKEQQELGNPLYSRFKLNADGTDLVDRKLFDGFPLTDPNSPEPTSFFPGDPIIESFNSNLTFGIVIPIDLGPLFRREQP